ncbi:MAG: hypothetical protein M3076_07610 [Actinomycetota bacterium]|nr:hypothetical protein [Actinomycetota bacterium]
MVSVSPGRVGGLALLVVCGLLGMALAIAGLHIYEIVREIDCSTSLGSTTDKPDLLALGVINILREAGPLLGLAAAVYLLAPAGEDEDE